MVTTNNTTVQSYRYDEYIKQPSALGISDKGTINNLTKNIDGLLSYVELLTSGTGKASTTGKPLGNKYFLNTTTKCSAVEMNGKLAKGKTAKEEDRFIYINNVPSGSKGLIPGVIIGAASLNPMGIMDAITAGAKPPCAKVTLQTINDKNKYSAETHYVALTDIEDIDPCSFWDAKKNKRVGQNLLTKSKCTEKFQTMSSETGEPKLPDDIVSQVYFASLAGLGLYIIYRFMHKY
jgi:hypothetical protein